MFLHMFLECYCDKIDTITAFILQVSECEKYDPETDTWESIPAMPGYRTQHAGTTWPSGGDYLFISGGLDGDVVLDSVQRYLIIPHHFQFIKNNFKCGTLPYSF